MGGGIEATSSLSTKVGAGASIRGIPGPRGGRRSRFRSTGETGGSSFSSCSPPKDFERGVVIGFGGNTKLDCFAVRRSSPRVGSGVIKPLEGLRPRAGVVETLRDGFVSSGSSDGISNVGMRKGSGGGGSPKSKRLRNVGGTFETGGGRTVDCPPGDSSSNNVSSELSGSKP